LAGRLAIAGGEKAEELHVTLAFMGNAAGLDFDRAHGAVESWAARTPVLDGELSGIGHFDLGAGKTATYRSVDLPKLPEPREELVGLLDAAGVPPKRDHGFSPHMTLDYKMRRPPVRKQPITFSKVTLTWGDERHEFPLTGRS